MRVGYWLDAASIAVGGTGPYAWRVLETLLTAPTSACQFVILCHPDRAQTCHDLARQHRSSARIVTIPPKFPLGIRAWCKLGRMVAKNPAPAFDPWYRWISSLHLDLLHLPYAHAPPGKVPCPWLCTMHDVLELHHPEFFSPRDRAVRAERCWKTLEACDGVVVSFAHVQCDLLKFFALPQNKVFVCPLPFQRIQLRESDADQQARLREKYAGWHNFLLYPAQTWPHKNHLGLIRAIQHLRDKTGRTVQLLCTGRKNPKFFSKIEATLHASGVAAQVRFLDVVAEEELCWLYKHCALVVIPTLYEAGSFPLLEAMSLEVPVICSTVTSLPETIGDARFTFDPRNAEELAALIARMLDDAELRQANVKNGQVRTQQLRETDNFPSLLRAWQTTLGDQAQCA